MEEDRPAVVQLFSAVATRLEAYDRRLEPAVAGDVLWVTEPASGRPVTLSVTPDGRGNTKLVAAAKVDKAVSRALGSTLGRMLGMVQVVSGDDSNEVRRWSPYRLEDIERTPQEAIDWATSTVETMLEELRLRAVPAWQPPSGGARQQTNSVAAAATERGSQAVSDVTSEREAVLERTVAEARTELAVARDEVARLQRTLQDVTRERDLAASTQGSHPPAPAAAATVVPVLARALELAADGGARPSTCVELLRQFLLIAPGDERLREGLGIYLLRDDRVGEALAELGDLGAAGLTPRGASALVEASFRQRALPAPLEVLGRVDWRMGNVAAGLRDLPTWAPRDRLLEIASIVQLGAPPEFEAFLGAVARVVPAARLHELFDLWFELDAGGSLQQVLEWLAAERVMLSQEWVRDAVQLALSSWDDDRRTARIALDLLGEEAANRRDDVSLLDLVELAHGRMRATEWRTWAIKWLRECASIDGEPAETDRCAGLALELVRDLPSARDGDPEHELLRVLEHLASPALSERLRAELDRLRPQDITVRDVTTVAEALKAAAERYPALVVLPEAERSAAKRGTVGVSKAREALLALGEVAGRYAAGDLDEGLDEALASLPGFKPDVSDTAKQQYQRDYLRVLPDKRRIMLGPHIDIGGEDGRAYLHIDRDRKRIIVGFLGHLRGRRDT